MTRDHGPAAPNAGTPDAGTPDAGTPDAPGDRIDVRPVTPDEIPDWVRALSVGFLRSPAVSPDELAARRTVVVPERTLGAFDEGRCVATFRSFEQEITAVGGTPVPADAISNVTVTATHRRRGLLSRMMAHDLAAAKERGDVVATLIAAEYRIYGRYGFGPAASTTEWTIDAARTGLDPRWSRPADGGRIDLVDGAEVRKTGPELHERLRRAQHGAVSRRDRWWQIATGTVRLDAGPWNEPYYAVYRAADGEVQGMAAYTVDDTWVAKQPNDTATVQWLIAVTPAAERALWQYLCSIDWVTTIKTDGRASDDLLPHLLPDPRAARITTQADYLWVRVLDVVRALEARTYAGAGALVLDVVDRGGLAGGKFLLEAAADGSGRCAPTSRDVDLTLEVGELGALWLGDETVTRLVALGRVREERAGAARQADALLHTPRRPWCPDMF